MDKLPIVRVEALVDEVAGRHPERTALAFRGRCWTYAELRDEVHRRAAVLVEAGMLPGDVAATTEGVSDEAALTFLACCRADLTFLSLSPRLTHGEARALMERGSARLIFTPDGRPHPADPTLPTRPLRLPGDATCEAYHDAARRSASGTVEAVASLVATSGTTGSAPKLVMTPHRTMTFRRSSFASWDSDPGISYTPHALFVIRRLVEDLSHAMTIVYSCALDPQQIEEEMVSYSATALRTVPAVLQLLVEQRRPPPQGLALRSVRTISAPLPLPILRAAKERYPSITVINAYGSTEGGSLIESGSSSPEGSVGTPLPDVEVRIVNDLGEDAPAGEIGELLMRSPGLSLGYLHDPRATEEIFRDGWLRSGDLARQDASGNYFIVGRCVLRINVGGSKVIPEEVEAVIRQHPEVRDVVVTPYPDAARGEVVRAVIVPKHLGARPSAGELRRFCMRHLANYKIPRRWEFCDDLPRSPLGKVLRRMV